MAKPKNTAPTEDSPKRKMPTPEERVRRLEAELAAAKQRAEAKANAGRDKAKVKLDALVAKRDGIQSKIDEILIEFPTLRSSDSEDTEA